jgi:hypothetical protein
MLFLRWLASDLRRRPSGVSPATLLAVVLGFVSESFKAVSDKLFEEIPIGLNQKVLYRVIWSLLVALDCGRKSAWT